LAQDEILLQNNEEKAVPEFGNGAVHIGFSGVFEIFTLVSILDYFRSISGTDHSEPRDVDGGIKILANAHRRLAGEIL